MGLFKRKKVNIIKLSGIISSSSKKHLYLDRVQHLIDKAFRGRNISAVAVVINSPGGSPTQSQMISNYIMEKSKETSIKVITFIEDVGASGGYWLSLCGDEIYALSSTSIVGSLGVVYASFGLDEFISKYGISRRVYTSGDKKVSLDMFQKEDENDIIRLKNMLHDVHEHFKTWVISRRGERLNIDNSDLFSGEFWIASKALVYGLIDGIANTLEDKIKELYGKKIQINYLKSKESLINRLSIRGGLSTDDLIISIKDEQIKNKYGL